MHYTTCGIIGPIAGRLVHRLREDYSKSLHVSSTYANHEVVKFHYTNSGIIRPTGGRLVHRLREDYYKPLHVSSKCAHHQEVKIALHNLW